MTSCPSIARRRRLRRHARVTGFATVALLGVGAAIALPPAALAQELDPEAVASELEATIDQAFEGGGAVAPVDPASIPAAEPEPTLPTPSETAPEPAPESQQEEPDPVVAPAPPAPSAPTNINVDIRVLSPGDNGDVTQQIEDIVFRGGVAAPRGDPAPGGAPAPRGDAAPTWNWTWRWTSTCEPDMRASSAAAEWNWTWDWEQGCDGAMPSAEDLPDFTSDLPEEVLSGLGQAEPEAPPAETVAEGDFVASLGGPPTSRGHGGSQAVRDVAERAGSFDMTPTNFLTSVAGAGGGEPSVGSNRARATQGRRQQSAVRQRAPEQAPPALPSAAASGLSGGGSTAPLGAVLLALLSLLAPRALGLASFPSRRLSSQLSSSRLERPG